MATSLLVINHEIFLSKHLSTMCTIAESHFDKVTFRQNGSLDEVSFNEVSHFDVANRSCSEQV